MKKLILFIITMALLLFSGCSNNAENTLSELENEIDLLSTENQELRSELEETKVENTDLNNQIDTLLEEISKTTEDKEIIESLKNRIDELVNEKPPTLEEFEENKRLEVVAANYIEDTFSKVINDLEFGRLEKANELSLNDLGGFNLPTTDFYYARDYISIRIEEGRADAIYEVFDSETDERIYFISVSFIRDGYTWYVEEIESTMEP